MVLARARSLLRSSSTATTCLLTWKSLLSKLDSPSMVSGGRLERTVWRELRICPVNLLKARICSFNGAWGSFFIAFS